jgi:hypothetical protein
LRARVTLERLIQAYRKEEGLSTDAEAVCYLYTAAFKAPLNHEHNNIYLHLSAKVLKQEGRDVPNDVQCPETLSSYEQDCLSQLKRKIWDAAEKGYRKKNKKTKINPANL